MNKFVSTKMVICFVIAVALFLPAMPKAAAAVPGHKPIVAILPVIDNSSQRSGRFAVEAIEERLIAKFGNGNYIILSGQALLDTLNREGIADPRWADPYTLNAALLRMRVDYSVRTEILYVTLNQKVALPTVLLFMKTWTATVPLAVCVTDLNDGVVIYNSTIVETGSHEAIIGFANQSNAIRVALDKVLDRLDREIYLPE